MSKPPFLYDYINFVESSYQPNTVQATNNALALFFKRSLIQKAMGVFKVKLPDGWPLQYVLYTLFCTGHMCVFNTNKFGVIPQHCTLSGYNVFYQPNRALVSNPLINQTNDLVIGKNCEVLQLQPDYGGIMDTVNFYAALLALSAQAMGMNLVNSKFSYVFLAGTKAAAETAKKMFDQVNEGNPAVVVDTAAFKDAAGLKWELFEQNVKQNFVTPELLEVMRALENRFCTEVGLPNANTTKKERLITDEVNANNAETQSRAELWLDCLKQSAEKVNAMFDTDISFSFRWKEGGETVGSPVKCDGDV